MVFGVPITQTFLKLSVPCLGMSAACTESGSTAAAIVSNLHDMTLLPSSLACGRDRASATASFFVTSRSFTPEAEAYIAHAIEFPQHGEPRCGGKLRPPACMAKISASAARL
jgi:hypothetical protein